jgi:hypothetical protein
LRKPTGTIHDSAALLADNQTWVNILEPELCKDPAAVESLARLLFVIRREINSGPEGVLRASEVLSDGLSVMYLYTSAHKAALELYLLSLGGELKPRDEPLNLLNAAVERSRGKR